MNNGRGDKMAKMKLRLHPGISIFILTVLVGCAATFSNHGYAPTDNELQSIVVGVDDRAAVEKTIGRPASTGMLKDSGWYYVSTRVRHFSYKEATVIDRQLVAVSFNKRGIVENVERFTLADGRVVALSRRITKSGIKGISFIRQMLGNVGRVNLAEQL